jgi:hypothetical protein
VLNSSSSHRLLVRAKEVSISNLKFYDSNNLMFLFKKCSVLLFSSCA